MPEVGSAARRGTNTESHVSHLGGAGVKATALVITRAVVSKEELGLTS